jgi:hypothetical protein
MVHISPWEATVGLIKGAAAFGIVTSTVFIDHYLPNREHLIQLIQ